MTIADKMFRKLWDHRASAQQVRKTLLEQEIKTVEHQAEKVLDKIVYSESQTAMSALEKRLVSLEDDKRVIQEKISNCGRPVKPYDEMYRTSMQFLSNPYKLWAFGRYEEKRAVIKLVFTDRLTYVRNEGYRTPDLSLPFTLLSRMEKPLENSEDKGFQALLPPVKSSSNEGTSDPLLFGFEEMVPRRGLEPL